MRDVRRGLGSGYGCVNKCFRSREGEDVTKSGNSKKHILVRRDFRPMISNQLMFQVVAVHPVFLFQRFSL